MAGIGFVLQKVLKEGGIFSFVKVALAGTIIVAGPWLLSIIGIFVIGQFASAAIAESSTIFMAVIIYSYAFSLFIFGGIHYIFTRHVADLIFEHKNHEAGASLLLFSILIAFLAGIIGYMALSQLNLPGISRPDLFVAGGVLLFAGINLIWLLMIFISLLKRYLLIFFVYFVGMAASFIAVYEMGKNFGTGGAMMGFAAGQWVIVIFLFIMSFIKYFPGRLNVKLFFSYFVKFRYLLGSGIFYYWGMWIDKLIFWFTKGTPVDDSFFMVFDLYDIPVYLANLTIIPGLIFFMIISETNFYEALIDLLKTLHSSIYRKIQKKKYTLIKVFKQGMVEQSIFQGVFTFVFILLASYFSAAFFNNTIHILVFRITLLAVFFHLIFLTLTIYLFYLQMFKITFFTTFLYFIINTIGSILIVLFGNNNFLGFSYLAATMIGSLVSWRFLIPRMSRFDRILFIQASEGEI